MKISRRACLAGALLLLSGLPRAVYASLGDHLPEFRECVNTCSSANCQKGNAELPIHLRLFFWDCPANCDYVCQHIITERRRSREPPMLNPIVQFHGKWPFYRLLGIQEPASVLFSLFNLFAHHDGLAKIKSRVPDAYPLKKYYIWFGYIGMLSWIFSAVFHTRDFNVTEKLDYYAAGASVFYGLYYTPIRIFRMDRCQTPAQASRLRLWTLTCVIFYLGHISYLSFIRWDYTYNMAANVGAGIVQNVLWSSFSYRTYQKLRKPWAAWPGMIVAWIILAMSLELLDFAPILGVIDAHSLWHFGTVVPTIWWYNFLIKDAQQDIAGGRLKA